MMMIWWWYKWWTLGFGGCFMVFLSFSGKPTPFTSKISKGTWACMICSLYAHSPALSQGPTTSRVCEAFAPAEKKKTNAGWLIRNCNSTMRNALKHLKNLDHLHHLNDFVSKTTPIALRPILGSKKPPGRCVTPSWRFCNRDFNLVLGMNLLGALRSWKQMKQKDELCRARYSEMSDNTCFNTFHFFKSRALQHPAFRTCPKQLVRAPNVHSVSRTCCSAAAQPIYFWPSCKSFSAHHAGRSLAMLINHILLIPPSWVQWYPGLAWHYL